MLRRHAVLDVTALHLDALRVGKDALQSRGEVIDLLLGNRVAAREGDRQLVALCDTKCNETDDKKGVMPTHSRLKGFVSVFGALSRREYERMNSSVKLFYKDPS